MKRLLCIFPVLACYVAELLFGYAEDACRWIALRAFQRTERMTDWMNR